MNKKHLFLNYLSSNEIGENESIEKYCERVCGALNITPQYLKKKIKLILKKKGYNQGGNGLRHYLAKRKKGGDTKHSCNILVFDIETAPMKAYIWRLWKENISPTKQLLNTWFMLTWSAKWLFEDKVISAKLTPEEVAQEDDGRITKLIWELFEKADVVIAHNALRFDVPRLNTRFIKNGLHPPSPYQVIDTLAHARKRFAFPSNKLDYIARELGLGQKMDTGGFELWANCMNGDPGALKQMEVYNIQDVKLLEDLYLAMRPYIQPHPNLGLFIEDNVQVCPACASDRLEWNGTYATYANVFSSFRCSNCGSIGRSRKTELTKDDKRFLTLSTPK